MFFYGSRTRVGSGAIVFLISPRKERYYFSYRFQFTYTNNFVEYEALIQGLLLAQRRGIQSLKVFGDSELVINQVRNLNITKNSLLKAYRHRVCDLIEEFQAFNIQVVPRRLNTSVERLVAMGAQYNILEHIVDKREQLQSIILGAQYYDCCPSYCS